MEGVTLECLRDDIEKMDKIHQERIFNILKESKINYTKNSNGVFINMSLLNKKIIDQIKNYILYVELQQQQLNKVEEDKEHYKKTYYDNKDNKDNKSMITVEE
tara:strand:- start:3899 stop:4207 length:309 start_codon:yes stop_codon:yes gene_type:complete